MDASSPPPPAVPRQPVPGAQPSAYAIASLALGILGFFVLPIVGAILAIVFAGMADREIAASGGTVGGKGFADAGRILGIVGLVFAVLVIIAVIVAFLVLDWHVVRIEHLPELRFGDRFGR